MNDLELKQRFHRLRVDLEAATAKAEPFRAKRDQLIAKGATPAAMAKAIAAVKEAEKEQAAIQIKMGRIARYLRGGSLIADTSLPEHD